MFRRLNALLMICALALSGLAGLMPAAAQSGATVFIRPVDAETGESITDACFVLVDFSKEGCDENGDGQISFQGVPAGEYVVSQTSDASGYQHADDLTITVRSNPAEQRFTVRLNRIAGAKTDSPSEDVTLYIRTIDASSQFAITDVCYVLQSSSNEGCDDNGDGRVSFEGLHDGDNFTVVQTRRPDGYLPVGDFSITIVNDGGQQTIDVVMSTDRAITDSVDVAVVPYDAATGGGLSGACVVFQGGSNEGCDENGDGRIEFQGVPVGSYLLRETKAPAGYERVPDRWVALQADGRTLYLDHAPVEQVQPKPQVDVALVTRDPKTGEVLTGACYIILDASIEGCDENGDGQVDYEGVVPGTYTIHQTRAPNGYARIDDFEAQVSEFDPEQSILVKQAKEQYARGFRNVSVAIYDLDSGQRIKGEDVCVVLVDFSNEGCDLNGDGQIDFQDVPVGEYTIRATSLPSGYNVYFKDNLVVVEETNPLSIANALLVIVKP